MPERYKDVRPDNRPSKKQREATMGLAQYAVTAVGDCWCVLHDGNVEGDFVTKESAFESAIGAAALAIRQGHEIHVSVPGREAGNGTALGAKDNS
jgi:hypothetical protein